MLITIQLACIEELVGAHGNNRELSWGTAIESRFLATYSEIACFDSSVDHKTEQIVN